MTLFWGEKKGMRLQPLQVENNPKLNFTSHCGFINTDKIK